MTVIRGEAVRKSWGPTVALDGASFEIGKGVTGLLGPNGAGKTTLIGLILGLHKADSGTLTVLGRDPATAGPDVRGLLGYSPEHEALPPDTKAQDIVRQLAEIHGLPRKEATARASDVLQEVGLGEERLRPVGTMSTGQKQRVKLAQAMVHGPDIVLLDEPTNGLDPVQRDDMLDLIARIGSKLGMDVVLCSHLLEEVERVADAVVILDAGRVAKQGQMSDLAGSESELVINLDGPDVGSKVITRLKRRKVEARQENGELVVVLKNEATYDSVRDALASAGAGVRRMGRRRLRLEDVFFEERAGDPSTASSRPNGSAK
ncbi:MAG TPA: ABC transporter ATP-binding protein [Acidimicrobiales bacterium]|nr:ABC transporter ATP-binding protein [Acidimicrobiales bacterium]